MAGDVTFVILSFEGPDSYSHAGGLGSRVTKLSTALAGLGFETHLFFIGDPGLPGYELATDRFLNYHRWCQWISRFHPAGVYDGEEGKLYDWDHSLPYWLEAELLQPRISAGGSVVVIGEEWQTVNSILALHQIVQRRNWQEQVHLLWNANNTFSFHRIDWNALKSAATITTVSRYMKHVMWNFGVDARVIPNGISEDWLKPVDQDAAAQLSQVFEDRVSLVKVARWDPDKRWFMAVDAVAEMKRQNLRPLLLARGGMEKHGEEVLERAEQQGLSIAPVQWTGCGSEEMAEAIGSAIDADLIVLQSYLTEPQRRALFHSSNAVLANSGIEPFGLVGLETMAVSGLAFVGSTGEDYATHGYDSISLQTSHPREIVHYVSWLHKYDALAGRIRQSARLSAERYTWHSVIQRALIPTLEELGGTTFEREQEEELAASA
jgi:glycosyltransferase involved in cell wall biosynthesis